MKGKCAPWPLSYQPDGALKYEAFDVSDAVIQINKSSNVYPDEITEEQVCQYMHYIIPRIDKREMKNVNNGIIAWIIERYPKGNVGEIKKLEDCDLQGSTHQSDQKDGNIITAMLEYGDILMYGVWFEKY